MFSSTIVNDIVSSNLLDNLDSVASLKGDEINKIIDQNTERMLLITSRTQLRLSLANYTSDPQLDYQDKINSILLDAKNSISSFKEIFVVNTTFDVVAGTNESRINKPFSYLENYENTLDKIHIENFFLDDTNALNQYLTGPLLLNDIFLGTLVIISSADSFLSVVTNYIGLGKTGESFLVQKQTDSTVQCITPTRFDKHAGLNRTMNIPNSIDVFSNISSNRVNSISDYRNESVLLVSKYIQRTNWSLIVKIDRSETFAPVTFLENILLFLNLLSILFILFISFFVSNILSKPINKISIAAKRYSDGDLSYRINLHATDEVNDLAELINDMAFNLDQAQNKLEKTLMQLYQAQKMEALGRLAGGISHDFNNLLSIILGYCELAEMKVGNNSELTEDLQKIKEASLRAKSITSNLLVLSKKHERMNSLINLNDVIRKFLETFKDIVPEKISLKVDIPIEPFFILADKNQIEQIILNLVLNGKESILNEGEIKIGIKKANIEEQLDFGFQKVVPGSYIELLIYDNGVGIEENNLNKIFEPFWTTKANGTGLGLAIVYSIVEQTNGFIKVESKINVGTEIHILFREAQIESALQLTHNENNFRENNIDLEIDSAIKTDLSHKNVLIVDDNESIRDIIQRIISKEGLNSIIAENPEEAQTLFEKSDIDLLITDVIMPKMNGQELAKTLTNIKPDLKVIFITGYDKYQSDFESKHVVLQKPFRADELLKVLAGLFSDSN